MTVTMKNAVLWDVVWQTITAACCWIGLLFDTEDGGCMFLCNVGKLLPDYTASHPRR
jgi:hypothetical protein